LKIGLHPKAQNSNLKRGSLYPKIWSGS